VAQASPPTGTALAFSALRHRDYRKYLHTAVISMMGDNIEHVISYWMIFQQFHSPALAILFGPAWGLLANVLIYLPVTGLMVGPGRASGAGHRPLQCLVRAPGGERDGWGPSLSSRPAARLDPV